MVFRVFVEKKKELANEAKSLLGDVRTLLGIESLEDVRVFNRYDAENITEELFDYAIKTVFSEPQLDIVTDSVEEDDAYIFAVELKDKFGGVITADDIGLPVKSTGMPLPCGSTAIWTAK